METVTMQANNSNSAPVFDSTTKLNNKSSTNMDSSSSSSTNNDAAEPNNADDDEEKRDDDKQNSIENILEEESEETDRLLTEPQSPADLVNVAPFIAASASSMSNPTKSDSSVPHVATQDSVDYFGDDDEEEEEDQPSSPFTTSGLTPTTTTTTTDPLLLLLSKDNSIVGSSVSNEDTTLNVTNPNNNNNDSQQVSTATSATSATTSTNTTNPSTAIVGNNNNNNKFVLPEIVLRKPTQRHRHHHLSSKSSSNHSHSHSHNPHQPHKNRHRKVRRLSSEESEYQRPPDGGWGWVVVFASFMINLIADGVSLSFGVIFVELVDYFGETKAKTAWVGSLFLSIPLITGPIASALTDHFGCRKVAVAGSILAAAGFFFGQFSTCIEHLFIAFSISGFGLALCYVTSIVSVAYYFEKRRSLATGLAVCGTGFGTFLFAPFLIFLLEQYKWRGTLMILSAVFLNIVCFGLLIRDLNIDTSKDGQYSSSSSSSDSSSTGDDSSDDEGGGQSTSDIESNLIESESNSLCHEGCDEYFGCHHRNGSYRRNHRQGSRSPNFLAPEHLNPSLNSNCLNLSGNNCRIRHISECEPTVNTLPRVSASLINIPTFIKNNCFAPLGQKGQSSTQPNSANVELENGAKTSEPPLSEEVFGELTFRRGGYLHNLIRYYPHLLGLFLPWNLDCNNDLTVKTIHSPPQPSFEHNNPQLQSKTPLGPPGGNTITVPSIIPCERKSVEFNLPGLSLNRNNEVLPQPHEHEYEELDLKGVSNGSCPIANNTSTENGNVVHIGGNNKGIDCCNKSNNQMVTFSRPTTNGEGFGEGQRSNHHNRTTGALIGASFNGRHHGHGHGHRHSHLANVVQPDMLSGGNCLHNLRLQRGSLTYRSAMLIINKYRLKASSAPDIYRNSMATINGVEKRFTFFQNLKEILCDMVDLSNFKSIRYTIFCISNFFLYACIDVPYVYLPDQAVISGASEKEAASLLISILGVFNTLGVVFVGYIGDKPWLDASFIYALFISISGLSLAAIPLSNDYTVIAILSAIYGFTISANYSLVSVILVELISLDCFTNAYGLLLLVQGFGSLIGPPVAGWLFDITGTYDEAFYLTGFCVLFSGLFVIPIGKKKNCIFWSTKFPLNKSNLSPSSSKKSSRHSSSSSSSSSSPSTSKSSSSSSSKSSLSSSRSSISSSSVSLLFSTKPLANNSQVNGISNSNKIGNPGDIEIGDSANTRRCRHHRRNRSKHRENHHRDKKHHHHRHSHKHRHHRNKSNKQDKEVDDQEEDDSRNNRHNNKHHRDKKNDQIGENQPDTPIANNVL